MEVFLKDIEEAMSSDGFDCLLFGSNIIKYFFSISYFINLKL